jgi:hypothetical protein
MIAAIPGLPHSGKPALSQILFETSLEDGTGLSGAARAGLRG